MVEDDADVGADAANAGDAANAEAEAAIVEAWGAVVDGVEAIEESDAAGCVAVAGGVGLEELAGALACKLAAALASAADAESNCGC